MTFLQEGVAPNGALMQALSVANCSLCGAARHASPKSHGKCGQCPWRGNLPNSPTTRMQGMWLADRPINRSPHHGQALMPTGNRRLVVMPEDFRYFFAANLLFVF